MASERGRSIFADLETDADEEYSRWRRTVRLWRESLGEQWDVLTDDPLVVFGLSMLGLFAAVALAAPYVAPYGPVERLMDGALIVKWAEPSLLGSGKPYLFGTTAEGYDILSQLLYGARPALLVGFTAAVITATIGTAVALVAGYYGGPVDDLLMRIVDVAYGMPMLPTVILMVAMLGPGLENVIIAIVALQWRSSARVIRSQVLSLRERTFVKSARVAGASDWRIISRHIAPNVLPLTFLYGAFAVAWAILTEASVAFIGLGDPTQVSWGTMLQSAHSYDAISFGAWWWFLPPGVCIVLVVISGFLVGRGYEEVTNPKLQSN